jgi:hypothetical protein
MTIRTFLTRLSAVLFIAVAATAVAAAESSLPGAYTVQGKTADGQAYGGRVEIAPHGKGVTLDWALDRGDSYVGRGLQLDQVLGGVYWEPDERFNDPGIVVYRIDGGRLQGIWMPQGAPTNLVGREDLLGPASLEGRFEITLGEHPGGGSHYTGHVEVTRRGDTYFFHWYAPNDSYVGSGIRIGNIMVVGYAVGRAPGTVAYCIHGKDLDGAWAYGDQTRLGREALHRQTGASDAPARTDVQPECLPTIALDRPSDATAPRHFAEATGRP